MRGVWTKLIDKGAAATTVYMNTQSLQDLMLVVSSIGDAVDSAFTMTVYSSIDKDGTVKMPIGIMPSLTGTRDADGAIAFASADSTVAYEIPGSHPFIYITITGVTDIINVSLWIGGMEDN